MRQFSLIKAIPLSFYSGALYRDVARNWPGQGFLYLILCLFLFSIPTVLALLIGFSYFTLEKPFNVSYIINQIPEIRVENGNVSTQVKQPYYIHLESGETFAVIDTSRPVTEWSKEAVGMVIGKTQVLTKNKNKTELYDIPADENSTFDKHTANEIATSALPFVKWVPVFFWPFMLPVLFVYYIIIALLWGAGAWVVAKLAKAPLSYSQATRIAAVCLTPVMALGALDIALSSHSMVDYMLGHEPEKNILSHLLDGGFIITLLYILFAIRAIKRDDLADSHI